MNGQMNGETYMTGSLKYNNTEHQQPITNTLTLAYDI